MDEKWKERIEEKLQSQNGLLLDIHKELIGGEFNKGLYKTTVENTESIDKLGKRVDEHEIVINQVKTIRGWSVKALWTTFIAGIGYILWWIFGLIKSALKLVPAVAQHFFNGNNHSG